MRPRSLSYYYYGARVVISATVREAATGISLNATEKEIQIVRETTKVEFVSTTPKDFKPGMPFTGQVYNVHLTVEKEKLQ